ncbi:MAG: acetyl-CoA C-acetyltransferase [Janthinobacterium sp.]
MGDVVIVAAGRTAVGKFGGSLAKIPASELGAHVIKGLLAQTGIDPNLIGEAILGQVLTAAVGQNAARQAVIKAGLPSAIPAFTINKVCGSGLKATHLAAQAIKCGDANIIIAGGQENMSASPHAMNGSRDGFRMGDFKMIDTMIVDGLWDVYNQYHMGITAENVAKKYEVTRAEQDEFALQSQLKAEAAQKAGKFKDEILPLEIANKKGTVVFDSDEYIKPGSTLESLSGLRPAFAKDGTVTAGNASGLNDGAAAVIMMSASQAKELGLKPLARIKAYASSGLDPAVMGMGPVSASRLCLKKAGWRHEELDLMEINEAFAAQALAVIGDLGLDPSKVNPMGGAIALGHPLGATGAIRAATVIHALQRTKQKYGMVTMCVGAGMGAAGIFERV